MYLNNIILLRFNLDIILPLKQDIFISLRKSNFQVSIHPSSVMFSTKPEVVIFNELIATQKSYIRDLSLVDASWLLKDQPEYFRLHRGHIFALEDS